MTKLGISSDCLPGNLSKTEADLSPDTIDACCSKDLEMGSHWDDEKVQHENCQRQYEQQESLIIVENIGVSVNNGHERDAKKLKEHGVDVCRLLMQTCVNSTSDSNDWFCRTILVSTVIILAVLLFLVFGHHYICSVLLWMEHTDPTVSVLVMAALFLVICFPVALGLSILMVAAGYLYGLLYGPLVVTISVTIGLAMSTPIMRGICSGYIWSLFNSRKIEVIVNMVSGAQGMRIIALTRLTPIPFGLQNAIFSMSNISLVRYLLSSIFGLVPMTLLNCYMGTTLRNIQDLISNDGSSLCGFLIFGGQILITVILLWFMVRKARFELAKAMEETDKLHTATPSEDCPDIASATL